MTADDPTAVLSTPTPPPMPVSKTAFDMTTRELAALFALQGVLASHSHDTALPDAKTAAKWSREYADALLVELSTAPSV